MEEESCALPEMHANLCLRNAIIDSKEDRNILMCNTESDQCTVTSHSWHADAPSSRNVVCNKYLDTNNSIKCQIVSAHTLIEGHELKPNLIRIY